MVLRLSYLRNSLPVALNGRLAISVQPRRPNMGKKAGIVLLCWLLASKFRHASVFVHAKLSKGEFPVLVIDRIYPSR